MIIAITRRICIKPPTIGNQINPMSQSIIRTIAIDSSIRVIVSKQKPEDY
jgi:hypothetical protein